MLALRFGPFLAQQYGMSNDEKGATEEDTQKIHVIHGAEALDQIMRELM